jgi:hypothetical protein
MSVVGTNQPLPLFLQISSAPVNYSNKTTFQAAGWDLTWQDANGTNLSPQPTWSLPIAGDATTGRHLIKYEDPSGPYTIKITKPANGESTPTEVTGEGFSYDDNSIGAAIATSSGTVITETATSTAVPMFDGDSIYLTFSVPEAALVQIGATSLANCDTMAAEIKLDASDSSAAPEVTTPVETIVSDVVNIRTVRAIVATFPSVLAVITGQRSRAATAHLRLTKGGNTIIAAEIKITINWKATA